MKNKLVFPKKIASFLLSLSIIAGTLACLSATTLSAVTETSAEDLKPGVLSKVTYDFEGDTSSDFHWWAKGGEEGSKAEVKTDKDDNDNKVLSIKAASTSQNALVNLNYELEANTKYKISYRFKSINDTKIYNDYSGLFIGKNAPDSKAGGTPVTSSRLAVTYGADTGDKIAYPTEWTYVTHQIDTGNYVNVESKYFIFRFVMTAGTVDEKYGEIYLDDIVIEKIDPNVGFYDFENGMDGINSLELASVAKPVIEEINKDGVNTKALKLDIASYHYTGLAFPFELEVGATYKLSYDFKFTNSIDGLNSNSGIFPYVYEPTGRPADTAPRFGDFTFKANTAWQSREFIFTTTDTQVTGNNKYLYIAVQAEKSTNIYLDNVKIEKVVKLTFGEDISGAQPGTTVKLPTPTAKFGYTFEGWYSDRALTDSIGLAGQEITCPYVETTYYAKWTKNEKFSTGFEDGSYAPILSSGAHTPAVETDPDNKNNKVLKTKGTAGDVTGKYKFTLPVELKNGVSYTVSFKYKAVPNKTKNETKLDYVQLAYTGQNADETLSYLGSYIALADSNGNMQGKPLTLLLGDGDVDQLNNYNTPNKVYNTDWETRTYTFVANEYAVGKYAMLQAYIYYDEPEESIIYFDDISIQETPTATFDSNGGSEIASIKVAPNTVITPGCPIRAGYTFKGWYVNGEYAGFDKLTMPKENITYTAEWKRVLSVGNVDADEENVIDASDLTQLKKILLGSVAEYEITLADCTGNGTVDILDLVRLKKYLASPSEITLGKTVDGATGYQLVWNEEFDGDALDNDKFIADRT